MTGPVTARMLAERASADWEDWADGQPEWATGHPRSPLEVLDAGVLTQAEFWNLVNRAVPCACWSCDHQCGGAVDPGSCGLPEPDEMGRLICEVCRVVADAIDQYRQGAQVTRQGNSVCLDADVWGHQGNSKLHMSPQTATVLAQALLDRAAEVAALDAEQ